jgi:membrane protease YdiL (CAAX protease family)
MSATFPVSAEPESEPAKPVPRWKRWFVRSALARILIFVVLMGAMAFALNHQLRDAGWLAKDAGAVRRSVAILLQQLVPAGLAYLFLVRVIEHRRADELALRRWLPDGGKGLAIGLALISAVVAVLAVAGGYAITGFDPAALWWRDLLVVGLGTAVAEEILFRGVLFRVVEEGLGTWAALVISALFFGGVHMNNPNASLWSSFAIAVEAGLLLAALYHASRSLPLVIGVHAAWNFAQGTLYGIPVSGTRPSGLVIAETHGPAWLTGGAFGVEASVITVLLSAAITVGLVARARRLGTMVPWRR